MLNISDEAFKTQQFAGAARLATSQENQKTIANWTIESSRHVFATVFFEDLLMDLRPDLAAIKTPVTLIYPNNESVGQDAKQTESFYKSSYKNMSQMQFIRVDHSLHFVMLDQPDAFNLALDQALN